MEQRRHGKESVGAHQLSLAEGVDDLPAVESLNEVVVQLAERCHLVVAPTLGAVAGDVQLEHGRVVADSPVVAHGALDLRGAREREGKAPSAAATSGWHVGVFCWGGG